MNYTVRRPWDLPERSITPESVFLNRRQHRREFLQMLGLGALGIGLGGTLIGCNSGTDAEVLEAGKYSPQSIRDNIPTGESTDTSQEPASHARPYPAPRNETFEYGRDETQEVASARYTNFYEFRYTKDSWRYVAKFQPEPWTVEIDGLCQKPQKLDMDDILRKFSLEERRYRHRCVETWAMAVPWTGFRLRDLLKLVEPKAEAKFVAFETFNRPDEAPQMADSRFPWPYTEGLTLDEALNELTLIATGIYGHPLPKQNGAPLRLVVPWKYGFKSIKSIVRITLTDQQPPTFWNVQAPHEYGFEANVNPEVPHPRWSQRKEWMLGTREVFETQIYNGYGDFVGKLYPS